MASLGYTDPVTTTKELLQVSYSRACHYTAKNWISLLHFILKIVHGILTVIVESAQELGEW